MSFFSAGAAAKVRPGFASGAGRDALHQPFASTSIWNMPIGSSATYVAAGMGVPATFAEFPGADPFRLVLTPGAPLRSLKYSSAAWSGASRCTATGSDLDTLPMPDDFVVPSDNKNEGAIFLRPDGHAFISCQPIARCTAGGYATAVITHGDFDLYGDGLNDGHGGSGMCILGGTLRAGDMRPGDLGPRHALKFVIATGKYLFEATTEAETFRWPATTSDAGAVGFYGSETNNTNTAMKMGSLLALRPDSTLPSTLRTEPGKQFAWTMQNYGAYIVDGTGDDFIIPTEEGYAGSFVDQFAADYGFAFAQRANVNTDWVLDVKDIVAALYVVNNNTASTIGGGGTPRVPPAPSL